MRIALHGAGRMGQAVERVALERGHVITERFRESRPVSAESLAGCDVVVDFSTAAAIPALVDAAISAGVPLVVGTTGWNDDLERIRGRCEAGGIGLVYAANFSPGANIVFALARRAGALFAGVGGYEAGVEERHHSAKKDAPSGTALRIAREVSEGSENVFAPPISSLRVGKETGLHTVIFDSADDLVEIVHHARGREGFARGAILAAERMAGRKGFFRFDELLGL
jgi:4-hydroxy-tetrahydrodipicolinate reductase